MERKTFWNAGLFVTIASIATVAAYFTRKCRRKQQQLIPQSVEDLIGNTPLLYLSALSQRTGCHIYAKLEWMNPGGSSKDRLVQYLLNDAECKGLLRRPTSFDERNTFTVYEGTVGSTGIALALLCKRRGYKCYIILPNDVSQEKIQLLKALGANVHCVPSVSISDPHHYVHVAKRLAEQDPFGYWLNQFENPQNAIGHYETTSKEIVQQCRDLQLTPDCFIMGAGTGGTLAGISKRFKETYPDCQIILADPQGSGLYNRVQQGVLFNPATEREGTRHRHQVDSLIEGIGINRLTHNFLEARIDSAVQVSDQEAVDMAKWLLDNEGLFVGSSTAVHCAAIVKIADQFKNKRILTILCDSGQRYMNRFYNESLKLERGLS